MDNFLQVSLFEDSLPEMITEPRKSQKILRIKSEKGLPENLPEFRVIRSSRRKRSISALRQNGIIEIHIPDRMSRKDEIAVIPEMIEIVRYPDRERAEAFLEGFEAGLSALPDLS